jgi:hypothetical protein
VNAFLARHLVEAAGVPLRGLRARLPSAGRAHVVGKIPVRELIAETPLQTLAHAAPDAWLDHDVWLSIEADVSVEARERRRRHLRLDVDRFWIGRLRVPVTMLRIVLDPATAHLLRAPLPAAIGTVRVEPGRVVIQGAS